MAYTLRQHLIAALAILATIAPSISAVEYVVGDDKGWTINFDYQAWAKGKEFHVGDKLVFKYPAGVHNVFKVNATGFAQCAAPAGTASLTTGNDVVPLATEGRKWYICGVAKHCETGNQKLVITVLPQVSSPWASPSPSSSSFWPSSPGANPPSSASVGSASGFGLAVLLAIGVFGSFFAF